jgi:23S rRNA pseudoU1915 N3-methylase RlmH
MIKADKKSLVRIKKIYAVSKQVWPQSRMDCYIVNANKALIKEYKSKSIYDPKKLDDLEKFFSKRLELKREEEAEIRKLPKGDTLVLVDKHGKKWTAELLKEFINSCYKKKEFDRDFDYYF